MRIAPILMGAFLALTVALPAAAADEPPAAGPAAKSKDQEKVPGTRVEMPYLIAPIVVDEKLNGYAYVSSTIFASTPDRVGTVRDKIPFIQDAFVRDVNARPIGKADDPADVDQDALLARLRADVVKIVGRANVANFEIEHIQINRLEALRR